MGIVMTIQSGLPGAIEALPAASGISKIGYRRRHIPWNSGEFWDSVARAYYRLQYSGHW
jgi:hypothetical protein